MGLVQKLSDHPVLCAVCSVILFLFCSFLICLLLDALLRMHRSKTAVRKLKGRYRFFQRVGLRMYEENCLHALQFCKWMILFQGIGWGCFGIYIVILLGSEMLHLPASWSVWAGIGLLVMFDLPVFVINRILSRLFIGRPKGYSFEKYHNTKNHEDLF